ncbi:unnamed protein product [Adineta steineri]|uniref:G-protein coupled receptors family 1 profile domain-containing protein n=1 Tax=Adineta steineri TaxID=433720 RepID=A0A814E510_9BILA|nr:unnamed protein product [Adineta steineri]CAF0963957.1 unnamed protein product [Adineta steineri]
MTLDDKLDFVQHILTRYILTICFIFGLIGNLLNIIIFCRKHLRKNSCSVYFITTSIFNLLVICLGIIPIVVTSYSSYDYSSHSIIYCKFRGYIMHVLLMISRSSVALACIDRFALCSPYVHIRALNQRRIAIRLILIACLLWFIIPIHIPVHVNIQMPGRRCGTSGTYSVVYAIYAAIVTAIPLIIMVVFSSLTIHHLKHIRSRVHADMSIPTMNIQSRLRIRKRDAQFTRILISVVILYFFSTILFPIYSMYTAFTFKIFKDANHMAIEGFLRYIAISFLIYVNSSSIFYIHLLASKAFRRECKQLFLQLYKRKQSNNVPIPLAAITNAREQ